MTDRTAAVAGSPALNQAPRSLAEAVMERALRRIIEKTKDPYARMQASVALDAVEECRRAAAKEMPDESR